MEVEVVGQRLEEVKVARQRVQSATNLILLYVTIALGILQSILSTSFVGFVAGGFNLVLVHTKTLADLELTSLDAVLHVAQ